MFSEDYARANLLIPFDITDDTLAVAMVDPRNKKLIAELERLSNRRVVPYLASTESIERAHLLYRGDLLDLLKRAAEENASATASDETSPTELLTRIFEYAAVTAASDIHIEPYEHETLIRCRIDGVLREVLSAPAATIGPLAARIKALSGMRIDERRSPQDGRFDGTAGAVQFDLRVSSLPTHWGEKIVMRVLPKTRAMLDLEGLGFSERDLAIVRRNILRPFGMILVTGPTGCGKSTTLYAMLSRLGAERMNLVNISTIEDPVEHPLPRVTQVSVNAARRRRLRHRPPGAPASGSRHHHGRRDSRSRDGRNRRPRGAGRPTAHLDAPHQRFDDGDSAPDRHGRRALPARVDVDAGRRAAAGAPDLHELPPERGARGHHGRGRAPPAGVRRGAARAAEERPRDDHRRQTGERPALPWQRVRALRRNRLQRADCASASCSRSTPKSAR